MQRLNGLDGIISVESRVVIRDNDALYGVNSLGSLISIEGDLYIERNNALEDICGLYNASLSGDYLAIQQNAVLSMDTALAFETQLRNSGFTGTSEIDNNNGTGIVACDTLLTSWSKVYGGSSTDYFQDICPTNDGGHVAAGWTNSYGRGQDVWVVKLDADGNVLWQKAYGTSGAEEARTRHSIQQVGDGGYIVAANCDTDF